MSREEIYEQLNEVFRDVFDDDTIEVNDQTTSRDIEDWDSLEHINLIAAIETQFGMKFTMGQVVTMKNDGGYHLIPDPVIQSSQEKRSSGKPRDADRWRVPVWETPSWHSHVRSVLPELPRNGWFHNRCDKDSFYIF